MNEGGASEKRIDKDLEICIFCGEEDGLPSNCIHRRGRRQGKTERTLKRTPDLEAGWHCLPELHSMW